MIIATLGEKKLADLKSPQGKEELRKELLAKAEKTLASPRIKQIYFDEFLLQ
jgi:flagellar basal body-associated protein FliL